MRFRSVVLWGALAAICFFPDPKDPPAVQVRCIDRGGRDTACEPKFAYVDVPRRVAVTPLAPLHDFAYAAAEAGPAGCAWVLAGITLVAIVRGLWSQGMSGALRRGVLALALGAPVVVALLYTSCLLDGRVIRLGPEADAYVPASLHVHTDLSTGLLSPRNLVIWHVKRGFRVLNVSDKDTIQGGIAAREAYRQLERERGPIEPPLLVTVGDEWHGQPDIVFVNTTSEPKLPPEPPKDLSPEERHAYHLRHLADLAAAVHAEGGALFLAHPWSKVPGEMTLEEIFEANLDGVEVVNGVIHGGEARTRAAVAAKKGLFGVLDYKLGPHVNAITLLESRLAGTPEGVARAVREGNTLVLYAIPGGQQSSEEWKAASLGLRAAAAGIDSLREAPRARRGMWFAWALFLLLLWWLATRSHRGLGKAIARTLFVACATAELALLLFLWFRVREALGTVPVPYLLAAHAVIAVPLLAASHSLALLERHR